MNFQVDGGYTMNIVNKSYGPMVFYMLCLGEAGTFPLLPLPLPLPLPLLPLPSPYSSLQSRCRECGPHRRLLRV